VRGAVLFGVKLGMGFFYFESAWRTPQGYEAINKVRKGRCVLWKKETSGTGCLYCQPVWIGGL